MRLRQLLVVAAVCLFALTTVCAEAVKEVSKEVADKTEEEEKGCPSKVVSPTEELESLLQRRTVLLIITALIVITILFEFMKDNIEEMARGSMEPIIDSLWSELTVLGFVGVVAFIIGKTGVLNNLSCKIFAEWDRVTEALEACHMLLFFIMVLFICQILLLVFFGNRVSRRWMGFEEEIKENEEEKELEYVDMIQNQDHRQGSFRILSTPFDELISLIEYKTLRENFIFQKDATGHVKQSNIPEDFDFADYLSVLLGEELGEIVDVEPTTWLMLWVLSMLFYFVFAFDEIVRLTAFFLIGYSLLICVAFLNAKLDKIHHYLLPPLPHHEDAKPPIVKKRSNHKEAEKIGLTSGLKIGPDGARNTDYTIHIAHTVPRYRIMCKPEKRTWLGAKILGSPPTPHEMLFWFDRKGPGFTFTIIQWMLLINSIYLAMFGYYFCWVILALPLPMYFIVVLLCAALLPIVMLSFWLTPKLICKHVEVSNVGMLVNHKAVKEVIRVQKTKRSMRAIKMIATMNCKATNLSDDPEERQKVLNKMTKEQKDRFKELFEIFDKDGGGSISKREVGELLKSMGQNISPEELDVLLKQVDADGSGELDFDEFCYLVMGSTANEELDFEEMVRKIFSHFDKDNSGTVTAEEFKAVIKFLDPTFTEADISELVKEIDIDGDNEIDAEEFAGLLKRHALD